MIARLSTYMCAHAEIVFILPFRLTIALQNPGCPRGFTVRNVGEFRALPFRQRSFFAAVCHFALIRKDLLQDYKQIRPRLGFRERTQRVGLWPHLLGIILVSRVVYCGHGQTEFHQLTFGTLTRIKLRR